MRRAQGQGGLPPGASPTPGGAPRPGGASGAPGPGDDPRMAEAARLQQLQAQFGSGAGGLLAAAQQQEQALALALGLGGTPGAASGLGGLGGLAGIGGLGAAGAQGLGGMGQAGLLSQLGGAGGLGNAAGLGSVPGADTNLLLARALLQQQGGLSPADAAALGLSGTGAAAGLGGAAGRGGLAGLQAQHELELQLLQRQEAELAIARRQRAAEAEAAARAAAAGGQSPNPANIGARGGPGSGRELRLPGTSNLPGQEGSSRMSLPGRPPSAGQLGPGTAPSPAAAPVGDGIKEGLLLGKTGQLGSPSPKITGAVASAGSNRSTPAPVGGPAAVRPDNMASPRQALSGTAPGQALSATAPGQALSATAPGQALSGTAQPSPGFGPQVATSDKDIVSSVPGAANVSSAGSAPESAGAARPPGSVVVPCRARGMPMDHNFRTAYFVIPETVDHGEELICSYFACRNAGIKFRYCTHCKIPVAKRNFRKRHNHGLMGPPSSGNHSDDDSDGEESTNASDGVPRPLNSSGIGHSVSPPSAPGAILNKLSMQGPPGGIAPSAMQAPAGGIAPSAMQAPPGGIAPSAEAANHNEVASNSGPAPAFITQSRIEDGVSSIRAQTQSSTGNSQVEAQGGSQSQHPQKDGSQDLQPKEEKHQPEQPEGTISSQNGPPLGGGGSGSGSGAGDGPRVDRRRAERWASLLQERPSTGESNAMSQWLLEVLAVSDLDKPLKDESSENVKEESGHQNSQEATAVPGSGPQSGVNPHQQFPLPQAAPLPGSSHRGSSDKKVKKRLRHATNMGESNGIGGLNKRHKDLDGFGKR